MIALASISWTHLTQNLWQPCLTVIISRRTTVNVICANSYASSEIVKCCHSHIFRSMIPHYRWPADHFTLDRAHLSAHLQTFYTTVLQFVHSSHSGHKMYTHNPWWISTALMFLAWRKWTIEWILKVFVPFKSLHCISVCYILLVENLASNYDVTVTQPTFKLIRTSNNQKAKRPTVTT
jgi:hypothetical protein